MHPRENGITRRPRYYNNTSHRKKWMHCYTVISASKSCLVLLLLNRQDNSNSNGLSHITNSESSEWSVLLEGLTNHWFGWYELSQASISLLDNLWILLQNFSGTFVHLLQQFVESASDVRGVAIQYWGVSLLDLTWVIEDDDLSSESCSSLCWVLGGVGYNISSLYLLHGNVSYVETNIVSRNSLWNRLVMHLNGFNLRDNLGWCEVNLHTWFDDTGLNTSNWNCSDTSNLVHILEWKTEWFSSRSLRRNNVVQGLQKRFSLVPFHVVGFVNHVVTSPSGDWDEWNILWVVTNLLEVVGNVVLDLNVTRLSISSRLVVHLVDSNNHLLYSQGEAQECVLLGLTVVCESSLESTSGGIDNQDAHISLGGSGNHVLDEISVSWSINDGEHEFVSLELPQSNIDGDTTLSLSLKFVQNPSVLERSLSHLVCLLLEFLDLTWVNSSAFVDQMSSGGGFSCIYMSNYYQRYVLLVFSHDECVFCELCFV
mmetsp:Transcript_2520/g.9506  ORF Transcript_2520/g.9506 Transcript_2520/m.9506 type:complete len:484 (+) Transcript_2520:83-1534(+)